MHPRSAPDVYRFCPKCGFGLESKSLKQGEPQRLVCPGCDFIFYLDPGLTLGRGPDEFSLSVPIRLRQDFRRSLFERANGKAFGGDLADLLVFAGYTHRF